MTTLWAIVVACWFLIGVGVFWINITSMPVTFGLAVFRGLLWPIAWLPLLRGRQMPMD